ncbi:hypothetical protein CRENBAI_014778 [Crenichthys baileyi]|uniref:C2H2-type domain-containing protein n=1 Tax=Crenichthys baileyi TaxID=28760 RepID=A0AAV9QST6_9TELE
MPSLTPQMFDGVEVRPAGMTSYPLHSQTLALVRDKLCSGGASVDVLEGRVQSLRVEICEVVVLQMMSVPEPEKNEINVLMERQAHLPTTHKFSREPRKHLHRVRSVNHCLYHRVIKNQPPPILSIELDQNPFKCPAPGCSKSFRKASLLHYHIKYYHSDQLDTGGEPEASRRKRSSSEGGDFPSSKKADIQTSSCQRSNREQSIMGAELKKDERKEKGERKHFLRVKLRKKRRRRRRKVRQVTDDQTLDFLLTALTLSHLRGILELQFSLDISCYFLMFYLHEICVTMFNTEAFLLEHTEEDSRSAGFGSSEDEPPDRPPVTLKLSNSHADDGSDWSTLTAESGEDTSWPAYGDGRCVSRCLCWQHGTCMGLYEHNVPHNYICYYCRQTSGWRRAQRFLSEPDLLISGHMFGLSCVKENYSEINASKISHTSHLLAQTHTLHQVLSGLQLKISLLHSSSHSDLQLWGSPWRQEEALKLTSSQKDEPPICYVSSEHCYQKPDASWETAEENLMMGDAKEKDTNTVTHSDSHLILNIKPENHTDDEEPPHRQTSVSVAQCRLNLLEHVEVLHHQISARMDLIERELDVLESWLDHSGELEPPDPLSRLPQLKQRIRRLLGDLCTVRRLAVCR